MHLILNDSFISFDVLFYLIDNLNEFTPFVKYLKSEEFIEPLFHRIENEWNHYVVYEAVEMLASYNDKKLNKRIIPASRLNKNLVDNYTSRQDVESSIKTIVKKNGG